MSCSVVNGINGQVGLGWFQSWSFWSDFFLLEIERGVLFLATGCSVKRVQAAANTGGYCNNNKENLKGDVLLLLWAVAHIHTRAIKKTCVIRQGERNSTKFNMSTSLEVAKGKKERRKNMSGNLIVEIVARDLGLSKKCDKNLWQRSGGGSNVYFACFKWFQMNHNVTEFETLGHRLTTAKYLMKLGTKRWQLSQQNNAKKNTKSP